VAATDPELLEEIEEPIAQFTIDRPFRFDKKKTGSRSALYAENHFRVVSGLTAYIGLRFDDYNVASKEHAASPRIGLAYHLRQTNTVFRAAYNRLFQTPPLENVLLSSSADAGILSRLADSTTARIVLPEKQNYYEFGLQQQVARHFRIDAVRYVKTVRNFSDEQQLFSTGIVFPVSISGADIRGIETRLDLVYRPSRFHGLCKLRQRARLDHDACYWRPLSAWQRNGGRGRQ